MATLDFGLIARLLLAVLWRHDWLLLLEGIRNTLVLCPKCYVEDVDCVHSVYVEVESTRRLSAHENCWLQVVCMYVYMYVCTVCDEQTTHTT
jgi:hypothetical protein